MYCANCGVKLSDSVSTCPLCGTRAFHPDLQRELTPGPFPKDRHPAKPKRTFLGQVILTVLFLLPVLIVLLCDFQISGGVTWSGYVVGAVLLGYVVVVLPTWFRKPNMVIFVPCDFGAVALYLLYIDLVVRGGWFLSFGLPVTAGVGLIVTAVVVLTKYVPRGSLYTFGGACMAMGFFTVLVEFLMNLTFQFPMRIVWSLYPLIILFLLGGLLIFLAICRPARETLERKIFI